MISLKVIVDKNILTKSKENRYSYMFKDLGKLKEASVLFRFS